MVPPASPFAPARRRAAAALAAVLAALALAACGGSSSGEAGAERSAASRRPPPPPARIVLRRQILTFVDARRTVRRRTGAVEPRRLVTVVRYPRVVGGTARDRARRFPLVVFAHGYALAPRSYNRLLHAWTRAGFVVAAPALPGEYAGAPGGPARSDLANEPGDLRFLIDRLTRRFPRREALRAVDPSRVAVAGHSDGGDAAVAVAFDPRYRSRRVDAAVILAGADLPGRAGAAFPRSGPPLLAVQGSADGVNPPAATAAFYRRAPRPKFLLTLLGAGHYDPYMSRQPQLSVVAQVSSAFLRRTVAGADVPLSALARRGRRPGISTLRVDAGS